MTFFTLINSVIILIFALVGWALCRIVIGVGMKITTMNKTLIIHAIAAPLIFVGLSFFYETCTSSVN